MKEIMAKLEQKNQEEIDKINKQYRICFIWGKDNHAYEVEITDYHHGSFSDLLTD